MLSYQASFRGYAAATSPGDVIAFDLHTWHASVGGRDRLAWNAVYLRCPETDDERIARSGTRATGSSRRSAASTGTGTRYGGTGSPAPPPIRAARR